MALMSAGAVPEWDEAYLKASENGSEARAGPGEWLSFYNQVRPHSSSGDLTPDGFYEAWLKKAALAMKVMRKAGIAHDMKKWGNRLPLEIC